jgi:hypothetical protein
MTATTDTTGTALSQVAPGVLAQVQGHATWTVADLAGKLAGPAHELPKDAPAPKPAKQVTLTAQLKASLSKLPKVFGQTTPGKARKLEKAELEALTEEAIAIAAVVTPLGQRAEAISETVRHHMDAVGPKSAPRIADGKAKGHRLLARPGEPFNVDVEGYTEPWQQRYVSGAAKPSPARLLALYEAGQITREEYLGFTREARVYDEEKVAAFIRKDPGRGLEILGAITERSAPGASLYAPKK